MQLPYSTERARPAGAHPIRARQQRPRTQQTHPLPLLLLLVANYGDAVSTWAVLRAGGHEALPLPALALHLGGFPAFLLLKSAAALGLVVAVVLIERIWPERPWLAALLPWLVTLYLLALEAWNLHSVLLLAHLG